MNFICLIGEKSIEATIQTYRALKRPNDYYVTEAQLNSLGYRLLEVKKVSEAIDIFRLSVEAYPPVRQRLRQPRVRPP